MLRRTATLIAIAALIAPALARTNEWEEDYSDEWRDDGPPADDYPVSVDVDASASVSFETFQGALTPYGEWVVAGSYGRVWRPHVAAGWRPYYYGRWEWTNEGWLWVSDEPFGWAAYHYGRWAQDPYYGWVWVPGYQWAPAWVSWRYSGDVVGWAPLAPGVSVYVSVTPYSDAWWTFVPCNGFVGSPVYRIAYAPTYTRRYFYATAPAPARPVVNGVRPVAAPVWGGPPRRTIEQRIGRPVAPVRVVPAPSPGAARVQPGEVAIYRPELRGHAGRAAPGAVSRPDVHGPRVENGPAAAPPQVERPHVQERSPGSGPAPAPRGDEGRFTPRTSPAPAPDRGPGRQERSFTPRSEGLPPRPEAQGNVAPSAPSVRPEPRGNAAPRFDFHPGSGPTAGPRPEIRAAPAPRVEAGGGGGRRMPEGSGRGERRR